MKILLIRPAPSPETIGLQHVMIVEPLELEVLAALIDPLDEPIILDMILETRSLEYFINAENPDVVCLTGYITHVNIIIDYCKKIKTIDQKIVTIVGGVHCEVCPDDFNDKSIDFRVIRNATIGFPKLINQIKNGSRNPAGVLQYGDRKDLPTLPDFNFYYPFPNRELTAKYRDSYFYIFHDKVALIKTSFGCPFHCNFCFCTRITEDHFFERPLKDVFAELSNIRETEIYIVDDDFLVHKKRIQAFIEANKKLQLNKKYLIYGRADFIARNPSIIHDFRDVGLSTVIVGFESFFEEELLSYQKGISTSVNIKAMEVLNSLGIDCYATIIIPPHWTRDHFDRCYEKMNQLGIHYVNLQPLTPLPGTKITDTDFDLVIDRNEYEKWDLAHITVQPTELSIPDFYHEIVRLYDRIIYRRSVFLKYINRYSLSQVWKMMSGSYKVKKQYLQKIKSAKRQSYA